MSADDLIKVARQWLIRAHSNLQLGKVGLNTPGVMYEDACFHAQQCAEKALKGLLTLRGISFPRTHGIEVLLDLLKEDGVNIPFHIDEADALTQYAV